MAQEGSSKSLGKVVIGEATRDFPVLFLLPWTCILDYRNRQRGEWHVNTGSWISPKYIDRRLGDFTENLHSPTQLSYVVSADYLL